MPLVILLTIVIGSRQSSKKKNPFQHILCISLQVQVWNFFCLEGLQFGGGDTCNFGQVLSFQYYLCEAISTIEINDL